MNTRNHLPSDSVLPFRQGDRRSPGILTTSAPHSGGLIRNAAAAHSSEHSRTPFWKADGLAKREKSLRFAVAGGRAAEGQRRCSGGTRKAAERKSTATDGR
jgi:hypothetical protein